MKYKMQGVYTALITPFNDQGELCQETLISLLHHQERSGVDGVVVLGSTGEAATLDDNERNLVISTAVQELKGKIPVVVGCGSPSTKKTVEMCKRAEQLGADALLVVTPYYNRPTQEGIFLHFQAVSQASTLPLCVYNIPSRCAQNIEMSTMLRLANLPNVVAVKESSSNFSQITDMVEQLCMKNPNFTLLSGDDPLTILMMAVGAHGVISVLSNFLPGAVLRKVRAMQAGNVALARSIHYSLKQLMQVIFIETNPIPIKYLMSLANFNSGNLRLPLCQPTKASQEKLEMAFAKLKELMDQEVAFQPLVEVKR